MKPALRILAGPFARARLRERGLDPADVLAVPGAAGGPKGLILNPLDRFLFGHWLAGEGAPVHLLGASIGAWRMASACLPDAAAALAEMARHYVEESYLDAAEVERARASGRPVRQPGAAAVSRAFRARLACHIGARTDALLTHPRFRLHLFTSRGVHPLLRREGRLRTLAGYAGAYAANLRSRARMGGWLERVVFSDARDALPFALDDYAGRTCALGPHNSFEALVASCSIPFWLQAVHDIPGAPPRCLLGRRHHRLPSAPGLRLGAARGGGACAVQGAGGLAQKRAQAGGDVDPELGGGDHELGRGEPEVGGGVDRGVGRDAGGRPCGRPPAGALPAFSAQRRPRLAGQVAARAPSRHRAPRQRGAAGSGYGLDRPTPQRQAARPARFQGLRGRSCGARSGVAARDRGERAPRRRVRSARRGGRAIEAEALGEG